MASEVSAAGVNLDQDTRNTLLQGMMGIKIFDHFASLIATTSKQLSDTAYLNSYNSCGNKLPQSSDVVVVGAGIHALIYAIHTKSLELHGDGSKSNPSPVHVHLVLQYY